MYVNCISIRLMKKKKWILFRTRLILPEVNSIFRESQYHIIPKDFMAMICKNFHLKVFSLKRTSS